MARLPATPTRRAGRCCPPTNIAPTSADKTVVTPEDTEYTFSSADFAFTDTDGGSLSSVKIVTLPVLGTLTLSGTALTSGDLPQTVATAQIGTLKYGPPANESGIALASFTFRVNDGTADSVATNTMTVNVTAVPDLLPVQPGITGMGLVSNFGESASSSGAAFGANGESDLAQVFTTGTHATGYTLTSVEMVFFADISAADIGDLSVSVWSVDSSGNPQTKQFDLTNPASIDSATFATTTIGTIDVETVTGNYAVFTAPSKTTLTQMMPPTMAYAFVVTYDQLGLLFTTASDTETSAASGWSIANEGRIKSSGGSWSDIQTILIRVNGEAKANTAPTSADKEVVTDEDTEYTFSSADFPFTDTDTGATLASVKIVTLPFFGTLTLSGTAITSGDLPQTVTAAELAASNLKYVPSVNNNGFPLSNFTFRVNDGTADSVATNTMAVNVTAVNDAPTGQPGITGTAQVGEVLTATAGDIADVDGLPNPFFESGTTTVQWLRVDGGNETDIPSATAFTYTLVAADEGKTIKVKVVSFKDQQSVANGPLTSNAYPSSGTVLPAPNIAPTSADKTVDTPEDTDYTFSSADFAFTDTDGGSLSSVKIVTLPATDKGTLTLSGTVLTSGDLPQTVVTAQIGTLKYVPPANDNGAALASFTFRVNDGTDDSVATKTMTVNVTAVNDAPTSADKTVATNENTDYTFSSADFPFSDTDGDSLSSVKIVTLSFFGTLRLSGTALTSGDLPQTVTAADLAAGNLKFAPDRINRGEFDVRVNDGTADSAATYGMAVTVTLVNDAPTGQPGITGTAQVGEVLTATAGDIADVDGLPNPFFESGTTTVQWLRVDGGNETDIPGATDFTYTLVAADEGKTIKVKVVSFKDQQSFANGPLTSDAYPSGATVLPAANNPPTSADKTVVTPEDTDYTFLTADFAFTDTDGGSLSSVKIVTLPATGTLTLSGTALTSGDLPQTVGAAQIGTLKYVPPANDNGAALASFTFRVNDGTDDSVATKTMTVNVTAVNDAPTSADKTVVTPEDTDYTFLASDFAFTDTDMGVTLSNMKIVSLPATGKGTLTLSGTALTSGDLPQTVLYTDLAVGTLKYVPPANDNGAALASFTFRVNDGTADSVATNTMTVNVTAVNDAPTSADKTVDTPEDTDYTFLTADFAFTDTDMGDTLSSVKIVSLPAPGKGTLRLSGAALGSGSLPQTVSAADLTGGLLKYRPPANESGAALASFTFRVNDGTDDSVATKTMTVSVTAVNDATTGKPGIAGTARVGLALMATAGTIADPDGLPDPFLTDTNTSFQWVRVTSGTDADISGATASTYTLVDADNGKTIRVKVSFQDKGGSSVGPLTSDAYPSGAMVLPALSTNTAPTSADKTVVTPEDTAYTFSSADFAFTDTDVGDSLSSVKIVTLPAMGKGTLRLSGTAISPQTVAVAQIGNLSYVPPANDNGAALASFTFKVNDGTDDSAATNTMTVNVTAVNDAPTSADKTVVTPEDTDYTFLTADFAFTDTDMGDTLSSVKIVSLPARGTLTLTGTAITSGALPQTVTAAELAAGNLKYVPLANSNITVLFTFRVNDGTADSAATYAVSLGITVVSDVATGQPGITGTAQVGEVLTATVGDIADVDELPDPFFASGTTTVQWLRVDGGNETDIPSATDFTYTLVAADEGKTIKVKVVSFNDKTGFANGPLTSDAYPSSGTVLPAPNNPPTSADKTVATPEDTDYTFLTADFAFTDTDMGDTLSSVKVVTLPAAGTLTLAGTVLTSVDLPQTVTAADLTASNLKYVPPANESGAALASFTFRVNDGTDDSAATSTMTVNVTAVNDAAMGQPGIAGTARVGLALMATAGTIADPDGLPAPFLTDTNTSFQWVRVTSGTDADISGATASTYTLVDADNSKKIRVKVSFQDDDGSNEGPLTSDAYPSGGGTVLPALSTNAAPTSSNRTVTATEDTDYTFLTTDFAFTDTDMGDTLSSVKIVTRPASGKGTLRLSGAALGSGSTTVGAAELSGGLLKYRPPANESGAALASFTFRVNDGTDDSVATSTMTVNVTAVNDAATGKPGIAGTARVGQALMATAGTIADPDGLPSPLLTDTNTRFQWVRVTSGTDADISGATASTYTLVDADNSKKIRVKVSFQDDDGSNEGPLTSDAYPSGGGMVLPALSTNAAPTSSNRTVTATEDTDYTFLTADFAFTDTDMGDTLSSVKIVTLPAAGTLTLAGTALTSGALPQTVTAAALTASNLKYVPPANESGAALASFTFRVNDGTDDSVATKTMTVNVTAVSDAATGQPGIAGSALVGQVLMATVGTIADPDGLPAPFLTDPSTRFQWVRVTSGTDADISGATASTYTLVDADNGKTIRVKVSFQDKGGSSVGPLTSDAYPSGATVTLDATLRDLSLSIGTLDPPFSPTHLSYRVSVAAGVRRITFHIPSFRRATPPSSGSGLTVATRPIFQTSFINDAGDTVAFFLNDLPLTDADPGSVDTFEVDLSAGDNVIRVQVTTVDEVTKTYTVTVTVASSGGFLSAWVARFGRTVADQVLSSVGDRMTAPRTSGTEVRLAGHRLGAVDRDTSDQASGENTAGAGTMGREVEAKAAGKVAREAERKTADGLRALANQLGGDGNNGNYGKSGHDGLFGGFEARAAEQKSRGLTGREMLTSSSFTLTADTAGGDHGALWGRSAVSSFDGRTGGFGLDGEVVSVILGIDRTKGPAVVGVALGHSRGEGAYRSADGEAAHGEIVTTLIGIYPYVRYEVNERLSVWGVGGHGMGTMTLTPEGLAPMATNTDLVMAALGGRGVLRQPLDGIGLELAVRSDALAVRTTTKALRGSGVNLAATASAVTRLRLGLEGTWHNVLPLGLVPTFEIGVRYDGGDAETGFGADLGAGLTWADPVRGIRAAFHARGLVGHEDDGFQELGLSGLLYWDARPDSDLGWSLGIAQAMGARATGGMDALLNPDTPRVFGFDDPVDSSDALHDDDLDQRLAADLGYGFAMFGGRYTGTPAVGLRLSEAGRETVLGWSLAKSQKSGVVFVLDVAGRRHESVGGEPGHSFGGGFGWQRAGGRSGEPGFGVRFEADRDGGPEPRFGVRMMVRW